MNLKKILFYDFKSLFLLKNQQNLISDKIGKRKFIIIFIIILLGFQYLAYIFPNKIPSTQSRSDASGFSHCYAKHFIYFFYYTRLFPLATLENNLIYNKEGAKKHIKEQGKSLIMEYKHWSRLGENARIFAYIPDAIINGSPENPSIKLFNTIFFISGLILIFIAFSNINLPITGLIISAIIGTTPFYLYEVYNNQNIFGLIGSAAMILIAMHIKLIFDKKTSIWAFIIPLGSGIIIGFFTEIRKEIMPLIVSCIFIYIISKELNLLKKTLFIFLILISFFITKASIRNYFEHKFWLTHEIVRENGGHPYNGVRLKTHVFWHSLFCGLGDFDNKYNYIWDDEPAYAYAVPLIKEKYNISIKYSGEDYHFDDYYDKDKLYYKKFEEIPEYEKVLKDKVLSDIKNDPVWYIKILIKRIFMILTKTTPVSFLGWLIFPFLFLVIKFKQWQTLNLLLFTLPLSSTPLLIYSLKGTTYNSMYQIIILSLILSWLFEYILNKKNKGHSQHPVG